MNNNAVGYHYQTSPVPKPKTKLWFCRHCNDIFQSLPKLVEHLTNDEKKPVCEFCRRTSRGARRIKICDKCRYFYMGNPGLVRNEKRAYKHSYLCGGCDTRFLKTCVIDPALIEEAADEEDLVWQIDCVRSYLPVFVLITLLAIAFIACTILLNQILNP